MANYTEKDPITEETIWFIIQIVCKGGKCRYLNMGL